MTKEELIKEKEAQIQALKDEINELKDPISIKRLTKNEMLGSKYNEINFGFKYQWGGKDKAWEAIRHASMEIHRANHMGEDLIIKNLSREEVELSAQMADEMIDIWNAYITDIYGIGTYPEDVEPPEEFGDRVRIPIYKV